jgi:phosphate transport system substrate-binding protein
LIVALLLLTMPGGMVASQATPGASPDDVGATIRVAGSATLGPVIEAAGEAFSADVPDVIVEVERSNSGSGIERFCAGETDLATSGRTIRDEEAAACEDAGIDFSEFEVAFDGVAVVVHPDNADLTCLTVDQLKSMWEPESSVTSWADVDSALPDEPIGLYGTGEESGTYQFFTQVTVGEEGVSRDDYNVMDAHPDTADAVAEDPQGLGFLPFPRYLENQDRLKLVAIDGGDGCVEPSPDTIQDGSYVPLSRPMYVYVSHSSLARPEVQAFLTFWFADASGIAEAGGLVASQDEVYDANADALDAAIQGTPVIATPAR